MKKLTYLLLLFSTFCLSQGNILNGSTPEEIGIEIEEDGSSLEEIEGDRGFENNSFFIANVNFEKFNKTSEFNNDNSNSNNSLSFEDRTYIKGVGIEAFSNDLEKLIGKIIIVDEDKSILSLRSFKLDSAVLKTSKPKFQEIEALKYTTTDDKKLGFFIKAELKEDEILEYTRTDISRMVIGDNDINFDKLKLSYQTLKSTKPSAIIKVVTGVTVTEITTREFKKSSRVLKASGFSIATNAFSYGDYFYITNDKFKRFYRIGLSTFEITPLSFID
ncbi:hypothetical protein [Lacinutrix sp. 5H-3-7-4]|uniref:hypothetical protein n=1 Tax=Lacinutrix sp. (strain 5H-3-7-4) TaxID=983544 RepID=UPI00020A3833|nr:hypothetical protein [Lacinutrix sp. 5H-3-7-4]AEH02132.1 hypothetical protein Lacal_2289 [Lacinutrix sp. 5H-3-7-4]